MKGTVIGKIGQWWEEGGSDNSGGEEGKEETVM